MLIEQRHRMATMKQNYVRWITNHLKAVVNGNYTGACSCFLLVADGRYRKWANTFIYNVDIVSRKWAEFFLSPIEKSVHLDYADPKHDVLFQPVRSAYTRTKSILHVMMNTCLLLTENQLMFCRLTKCILLKYMFSMLNRQTQSKNATF
jgi:hypothetical protein